MAKAPRRTRTTGPTDRERLAVIETRLEETLNALPAAIEAAIARALANVPSLSAVETLQATVAAQAAQIQTLQTAQAYGAGAVKVENRVRSQAQEWARLIFPYLLTLAGLALGYKALT